MIQLFNDDQRYETLSFLNRMTAIGSSMKMFVSKIIVFVKSVGIVFFTRHGSSLEEVNIFVKGPYWLVLP